MVSSGRCSLFAGHSPKSASLGWKVTAGAAARAGRGQDRTRARATATITRHERSIGALLRVDVEDVLPGMSQGSFHNAPPASAEPATGCGDPLCMPGLPLGLPVFGEGLTSD